MDFASGQGHNRSFHADEAFRPRLHQNARDFAAGRRNNAIHSQRATCYEGPSVNSWLSSSHDDNPLNGYD